MTVAYTAAGLGIVIAASILFLVRRDRLHGGQALWWLAIAAGSLVAGFMPSVVDRIGLLFGVHYPPMLLVLIVVAALLLKLLQVDINISRRERRMRRVIQKLAVLELEVRELRELRDQQEERQSEDTTSSSTGPGPAVPLEPPSRRKAAG
jgi:hypothetical protein